MGCIRDSEIQNLKVGDVFYECEMGRNIEARVTEAPVEGKGIEGRTTWSWKAVNTQNGKEIDYLITEGYSHYGPRLYTDPEYVCFVNGEVVAPLVGAA